MDTKPKCTVAALVIQSLSHVQLFATPWTAVCQASRSLAISQSLLKLSQSSPPTISSSAAPSLPAFNLSQHQGLFRWVSSLHQVAKYWSFSFSISPSNKYSGLISFRMDWLDLLAVQDSQESSPIPQFKSTCSSALNFLYSLTFTSIHDYWKNYSFDYTNLHWQSNVSAF